MEYGWNEAGDISLYDKLKADLKTAMKSKDTTAKNVIRVIMAEYPKLTVPITLEDGKKSSRPKTPEEITNDDVLNLIQGIIKGEKTLLEAKKEASSPDLEMMLRYLPQPATEEEIRAFIEANIDLSSFNTPMQAMGGIMKHFGKKADGNTVKAILQTYVK